MGVLIIIIINYRLDNYPRGQLFVSVKVMGELRLNELAAKLYHMTTSIHLNFGTNAPICYWEIGHHSVSCIEMLWRRIEGTRSRSSQVDHESRHIIRLLCAGLCTRLCRGRVPEMSIPGFKFTWHWKIIPSLVWLEFRLGLGCATWRNY